MKKVVVWGLGKTYNQFFNTLKYFELMNVFNIVGLTDSSLPNYTYLDGWKLVGKSELCFWEFDYVIVMSDNYFNEIMNDAIASGVSKEKIISYKILHVPISCIDEYYRIHQSRVTIISNNCWGGIFYSSLGLECLSPFKNLFVKCEDYIKLINNLEWYLSRELVFAEYGVDPHCNNVYPIMRLDDIEIHCNHDNNPNEAKEKWERRIKKINWDNILLEMYTESKIIAEDFCNVQHEKKYCLFHLN